MLDFDAAIARAEAESDVIPANAAGQIGKACKAGLFHLSALAEAATRSSNLAIPLISALTVNIARVDGEAARYVHWGATSQDVIDTATMLGLRAAVGVSTRRVARCRRPLRLIQSTVYPIKHQHYWTAV